MADDLKEGSDDFSQTPLLHQFLGSRQLRNQIGKSYACNYCN